MTSLMQSKRTKRQAVRQNSAEHAISPTLFGSRLQTCDWFVSSRIFKLTAKCNALAIYQDK